jgi:protein TonB
MFEQTFVEARGGAKRASSLGVSLVLQVVALSLLVIAPYLFSEHLVFTGMTDPMPPPMYSPTIQLGSAAPTPAHVVRVASAVPRPTSALTAPSHIPDRVERVNSANATAPAPDLVPVGVASGGAGVPWGKADGLVAFAPPSIGAPPERLKVGGNVQSAKCVACAPPVYPRFAVVGRIQGTVRMHAIIGRDGSVADLQVVSGHPLLVRAAMEAVRNWRYAPTLLNGLPVEVDTIIDVNFTLGQ